jgi:hypothetical protein
MSFCIQTADRPKGSATAAEAAKLAENGLELNALTQIANSRVQIMKTAMGLG